MSFDNEKNKNYFIIVIIFVIICIYGVFSIYFIKHFYFGTYINEINVSCKTVKEANELLLKESYNYTIKLEERNDVTEYIKGSNINFEYKGTKEKRTCPESNQRTDSKNFKDCTRDYCEQSEASWRWTAWEGKNTWISENHGTSDRSGDTYEKRGRRPVPGSGWNDP